MIRILPLILFLAPLASSASNEPTQWKLFWSDEFNGRTIDSAKWSPCERGRSDWNNTMTRDRRAFRIGGGTLRLFGYVNPGPTHNSPGFLSGGITSRGKFSFMHGKIVVRARFKSARGAWPALWMLGRDGAWPRNGEIDLMEHLNFDDRVYQTVHSGHTHSPAGAGGPPKGGTAAIRRDDWNTYGARWNEDRIVFTVNGKATFTYPRVASKGPEQWPFNQPFYLIFSMQVGGDWVGDPEPDDYPAHLEIDWVRVYQKAGDTSRNPTGGQVPGS